MAVKFTDNFNRSDSATMGNNWADGEGDGQIKSNQFYASGGVAVVYNSVTIGSANQYVQVKTSGADGSVAINVLARGTYSPSQTFYLVQQGTSTINMYKRVSGSWTQLGSNVSSTFTQNAILKITCNGSSIIGTYNGNDLITQTDTAISAEGKPGLRTSGAGGYADDFECGDLEAAPPDTTIKDIIGMGVIPFPR